MIMEQVIEEDVMHMLLNMFLLPIHAGDREEDIVC